MKTLRQLIMDTLEVLLSDEEIHSVTGFAAPLNRVKTRVRLVRSKNGNGIHLYIGKPNYREREFLASCKAAKTRPRKFWINFMPKKVKVAK